MAVVSEAELKQFLELPDHLRATAIALHKLGAATASEVAALTGKQRAVESDHLNTLKVAGYCTKQKRGRETVFTVVKR